MEKFFTFSWGAFALCSAVSIIYTLWDSSKCHRLVGHRYTANQAVIDISSPAVYLLWSLSNLIDDIPVLKGKYSEEVETLLIVLALPFMFVGFKVMSGRRKEAEARIKARTGIDFDKY